MNIFVIPTWYPNDIQPLSGIFIQDQVEAIAEFSPVTKVIVSTWGHEAAEISFRSLRSSIKALGGWMFGMHQGMRVQNGVCLIVNPGLVWTSRLPFGGLKRLLSINRKNLMVALDKFGVVDVIHAHVSYPAGYIAAKRSSEFGIPYVLTEHMGPFPFESLKQHGPPIPEIQEAFHSAKTSIAVSRALGNRIASFGFPQPCVIGNCVNEQKFLPGKPLGQKFIFLTLCAISEQKGIDQLLEAIALWNPSSHDFEFRIAGGGTMLPNFRRMANRLGLSDRIVWLGAVSPDATPRLYQDSHVFVLPSRYETFGVVFAEAMASGKPIIATRCGGPEDIVNATNGVLVDIGDVNGLADAMQFMARHWHKYDAMKIRQDFENRYSRKVIVDQLITIYHRVLED